MALLASLKINTLSPFIAFLNILWSASLDISETVAISGVSFGSLINLPTFATNASVSSAVPALGDPKRLKLL